MVANDKQVREFIWTADPVLEATGSVDHKNTFELEEHPIDEYRPLKVAIIGAGISGTTASVLIPAKVPNIDLTVYEKNGNVGGTWYENIYPGVRCDVPANVYQSTYAPNTQWSEEFAQGAEIREYWQNLAKENGVYKYTKFEQKVEKAEWSDDTNQWTLNITDLKTATAYEETYDFVITAIGVFNSWRLPDYPGIDTFKGHLRHSSNWDPNFDPSGKRVAVIGNGASGIQVVPELQKVVKHLDHYARSRTWIAGSIGGRDRQVGRMLFSEDQLKEFEDPVKYLEFRKALEATYWRRFGDIQKDSEANKKLKELFKDIMGQRLNKKPEMLDLMVPEFSPHCRRLTPGPGYLEALTEDNVSYINTPIGRITETGIETKDGVHREVDAIICSTGAKVDFAPSFPIVARGVDLSKAWTPNGQFGYPYTYMGVSTPGFPNLAFIHGKLTHSLSEQPLLLLINQNLGPYSSGWSGTVPHNDENQATYIARLLRKISSQGILTAEPLKEAADDFNAYADSFFPRTVLSENCSSWANGRRPGGKIHGLWPGSAAHVTFARRSPRWEDWKWTLRSETGNRFAYFGNGWTTKELDPESDIVPYLKLPEEIDLRDHHESWWDL